MVNELIICANRGTDWATRIKKDGTNVCDIPRCYFKNVIIFYGLY